MDQAPASIYADLPDEGRYLCSVPTMYRLLRAEEEVRERLVCHLAVWSRIRRGAIISS